MKHIKLFESYSKGKRIKFRFPEMFEIPRDINKNLMYLVDIFTGDGDTYFFLVDYPTLEKLYDVMNFRAISSAILSFSFLVDDNNKQDEFHRRYVERQMDVNELENVSIYLQHQKFGPPIYVWFGLDGIYFEEDRKKNLTAHVFDKDANSSDIYGPGGDSESYYIEFPKINSCVVFPHYANQNTVEKVSGGKLITDANKMMDEYLMSVYDEDEYQSLSDEQVDSIMLELIDREASQRIIEWVKKKFPNNIYREDSGGVEYVQFGQYSQYSSDYVKIYTSPSSSRESIERIKDNYEKKYRDQKNIYKDRVVKVPIDLIDAVMEKLPRNPKEFASMISKISPEEFKKIANLISKKTDYKVDTTSMKLIGLFPLDEPKKGKGKIDLPVWAGISPEMVRNSKDYEIYFACFNNIPLIDIIGNK